MAYNLGAECAAKIILRAYSEMMTHLPLHFKFTKNKVCDCYLQAAKQSFAWSKFIKLENTHKTNE